MQDVGSKAAVAPPNRVSCALRPQVRSHRTNNAVNLHLERIAPPISGGQHHDWRTVEGQNPAPVLT